MKSRSSVTNLHPISDFISPGLMTTIGEFEDQKTFPDGCSGLLGVVQGVSGSQATISLSVVALNGPHRRLITVGKFLRIQTAKALLIGVITSLQKQSRLDSGGETCVASAHVDLMGELDLHETGET